MPIKRVRRRSANKKIKVVFFRRSGPVAVIPLEEGTTVPSDWYSKDCLPQAFENSNSERPRSGVRGIFFFTMITRPLTELLEQ